MADHIKPLTSLRFFAAIWVIFYTYWPHLSGAFAFGPITKGYLGVDLFFILSGFIISHVYLDRLGEGGFSYREFITNRLARIYPLHVMMLGVTLAMVGVASWKGMSLDPNIAAWSALPAQILMMHAWGLAPIAGWNHPSWSISAEWFAYLNFPLFGWVAWKMRMRPILAIGLVAIMAIGLYAGFTAITHQSLTHATVFWGALRIVPAFGLGAALYLNFRSKRFQSGALSGKFVTSGLMLFALAVIAVTAYVSGSNTDFDPLIVLALGLLVLMVAQSGREGRGILSHPISIYLGEVSFAMYMVYVPWKWVFFKLAGFVVHRSDQILPLWLWGIGFVAILPLAAMAHHIVELPMRKVIRKWGSATSTSHHRVHTMM